MVLGRVPSVDSSMSSFRLYIVPLGADSRLQLLDDAPLLLHWIRQVQVGAC
jgi:hypothetical protein